MFAIWILVFREVLEAAMMVSIVAAATRGVTARWRWIGAGLLLGVAGAALVAASAGRLAEAMSGMGQEWFNASVLLAATAMIGWHVVWMARHGRALAADAGRFGDDVSHGRRPLTALMIVVALAVLREGSEVVLFGYGMVAGGSGSTDLITGGLLGLFSGIAIGVAMYAGLLRIPMRHFFRATNGLLILLAAGLGAAAAGFLAQADVLPTLANPLWNTSWLLADDAWLGRAMHALVGYTAQPSGMQLVFYVSIVALLAGGARIAAPRGDTARAVPAASPTT
ncbi:MAG: iron permease [Xanthomonadaceae bacterium]|nr:iron permease [Xanthomonadaceae bacterium]